MKRLISLLLCTIIFSCILSLEPYAATENVGVSAQCAALYSQDTGEFIYEKNSDMRHPMASTTKIMTAIVVLDRCSLDDTVTITPDSVGIEGSSIYLTDGEKISVETLLYALMLQSANDAAVALAIHTAGSVEAFAEMMNARATSLGLTDTHFVNPHGLDDDAHYTTARELAIIASEALSDPIFYEIVSTKKKTIYTNNGEYVRVLVNHNKLLTLYEGTVGIKTGYTKHTGRCLVSAAVRDGVTMICVTLDAPSDWSDHRSLLDIGFATHTRVTVLAERELSQEIKVMGTKHNMLTVTNSEPLSFVKNTEKSTEYKTVTDINTPLLPPIRQGDIVGTVSVVVDGKTVSTAPLIACEDIGK